MEACNYNVIHQHEHESNDKVCNKELEHEDKEKSPCAIVIRRPKKDTGKANNNGDGALGRGTKSIRKSLQKYSDRNSVVSIDAPDHTSRTSEVGESSSESNCDVNIEYGSSVFYVVWD